MKAPDLTQAPPRSPRVRLGGYTILPRLLDKARASIAGTLGEYRYGNPTDWHFYRFTGIDPDALLERVKAGGGDWAILQWVQETAPHKRSPFEIAQWAAWTETFAYHGVERRDWFTAEIRRLNPERDDIATVFDRLDLDDYVAFGGEA
ncbi:DUF5069 domain-containing protein [Verrucomicrobium sp. BvORR106]|uniref:DUF5069 domain-containing protein n=1 Tax=Verrucomicrobium sp. BvORR106 TaxID=1403819 RepID=UPI000571AB20|nr:DUF5069 domain-containing protein [Verrucomicrobium sp. BvORR106]